MRIASLLPLGAALLLAACGSTGQGGRTCPQPAADVPGTAQGCLIGTVTGPGRVAGHGDALDFTITVTNSCSTPAGGASGCGPQVAITDGAGKPVSTPPQRACPALAILLQPGQVVTQHAAWTVPQDLPAGAYRASPGQLYGAYGFSVC